MNRDEKCRVPGCNNPQQTRGLCDRHYSRFRKGNSEVAKYILAPRKRGALLKRPGVKGSYRKLFKFEVCAVDGCDAPKMRGQLCKKHFFLAISGDLADSETIEALEIYRQEMREKYDKEQRAFTCHFLKGHPVDFTGGVNA